MNCERCATHQECCGKFHADGSCCGQGVPVGDCDGSCMAEGFLTQAEIKCLLTGELPGEDDEERLA